MIVIELLSVHERQELRERFHTQYYAGDEGYLEGEAVLEEGMLLAQALKTLRSVVQWLEGENLELWQTSWKDGRAEALRHVPMKALRRAAGLGGDSDV